VHPEFGLTLVLQGRHKHDDAAAGQRQGGP